METFEHLLYQLHLSYLQARKNKRNTHNQLAFELSQETNLHQLAKAIFERKYTPKPCIAFIIQNPVMREIFAADFTDRVIHHLIYRCIYPIIDKKLIYDTYSCRVGKGTLFGINRAKGFMRSCSQDFTKETYVFCIETAERTATTWFSADSVCTVNGYKLPDYSDWYGATSTKTLTGEENDWEWVSNISQNNMMVVGNGGRRNRTFYDPESQTASYRCVYRKQ